MNIKLVDSNVKFTDRYQQRILAKFSLLDRYLSHLEEDLKIASLSIQKKIRGNYEMKFKMKLPFCDIYAHHKSPDLIPGIITLRDQVKRQIKENIERIRQPRR